MDVERTSHLSLKLQGDPCGSVAFIVKRKGHGTQMKYFISLLLLSVTAVLAVAFSASGANPHAPLPSFEGPALPAHRISPQAAYVQMLKDGSDVAPGLTLRQAVGLDPSTFHPTGPPAANTAPNGQVGLTAHFSQKPKRVIAYTPGVVYCWGSAQRSYTWGFFWPTSGTLYDHATWCGHYQYSLTSWSHAVTQGGSNCSPAGTNKWNSSYYSGAPIVKVMDWGTWNCSFGVNLGSAQRQMELSYNSYGADWIDWHN